MARGAARGLPPRVRLGLLVAVTALVVTAAVAGTLSMRGGDERSKGEPIETTVKQLRATAANAAGPIYWAGRGPGTRLELTETKAGKTFVRYLPSGVFGRRPANLLPYRGQLSRTTCRRRDREVLAQEDDGA